MPGDCSENGVYPGSRQPLASDHNISIAASSGFALTHNATFNTTSYHIRRVVSLYRMPEDDWDWQKELQRSEARLGAMGKLEDNKTRVGRDDSDGSDSDSDESLPGWEWHAFPADSALESILRGVCKVIDRVQTQGHSDRTAIVQKADELINRGVTAAYTGKTGVRIDYMPSFADMKGTLVEDTLPSYEKGRLRRERPLIRLEPSLMK